MKNFMHKTWTVFLVLSTVVILPSLGFHPAIGMQGDNLAEMEDQIINLTNQERTQGQRALIGRFG